MYIYTEGEFSTFFTVMGFYGWVAILALFYLAFNENKICSIRNMIGNVLNFKIKSTKEKWQTVNKNINGIESLNAEPF